MMPTFFRSAIAGAIAAAVALAVGELFGGLVSGAPSLIVAVGALVIDLQPPGAKQFVVEIFGEADKLALELAVVLVALLLGAALGVLAARRAWIGSAGFAAAGIVGIVAALGNPLVSPMLAVLGSLLAVAAGIFALRWLLAAARPPSPAPHGATVTTPMPDAARRRFLILAGGTASAAAVAGIFGRSMFGRAAAAPAAPTSLPVAAEALPSPPPAAILDVPGITPLVVPNEDFYRIDTSLVVPRLDRDAWRLRITGMVDREVELTYDQLLELPLMERYVTIACVSNEVGGGLVGNAKWAGVRLDEVLDMAGVQPGATQIVGRAFDGWTAGFPTAYGGPDGREGLIAIGMNDEVLPHAHGYPARLIIPGLYGYVSATKWLTEIELTTLEAFDGYWVPLGWAKEAPVLTQSRIDVPRSGGGLMAGRVPIAGVAWAPDRGIERVEVSIDNGSWQPAVLSAPLSDDTWVQWKLEWDATPGQHLLQVRATDRTGETQTDRRTRPAPDGARGWHMVAVTVS
ncbi:MAG: molybdopterin-dependent oxidoreductase [Chloroflexi bacterium]|nr:molybdopterin-dependent oxidoreductase [Chloroflexota bacterium]